MVFFVLKLLRLVLRLLLLPFKLVVRLVKAVYRYATGTSTDSDELDDWPSHDDGEPPSTDGAAEEPTTAGAAGTETDPGGSTDSEGTADRAVGPKGSGTGGGLDAGLAAAALGATGRERRLAQLFVLGLAGYAVLAALGPFLASVRPLPAVLGTVAYGAAAAGTYRGSAAARWVGTGLLVTGAVLVHLPFSVLSTLYDLGGPTLLDLLFFTVPALLASLGSAGQAALALVLAVVGYLGRGGVPSDTSFDALGGRSTGERSSPTDAVNALSAATPSSSASASGSTSSTRTGTAGTTGGSESTSAGQDTGSTPATSGTAASSASTASSETPTEGSEDTESRPSSSGPSSGTPDASGGGTGALTASGDWHRLDRHATALAVDGSTLVLAGDHVACHDPAGGERWTFEPRHAPTAVAVGDGSVYVGTDTGHVHSLDAGSGAEEWPLPFRAGTAVTDLDVGPHCYVAADDGRVRALDPDRGTSEWRVAVGGSAPALAVTEGGPVASGDELVALDTTGQERWRHEVRGTGRTPVAATDGRVVFGDGRTVTALDSEATTQWETSVDSTVTGLAAGRGTVVVAHESAVETLDVTDGARMDGLDVEAVAVAAPPSVVATDESVRISRQ